MKTEHRNLKTFEEPYAQVVLRMHGCHDIIVNSAHARTFGDDNFTVLKSPLDLGQLAGFGETITSSKRAEPCYCDKIGAVFALRSNFCVFESAYVALSGAQQETLGLGYFQVRSRKELRRYNVFNVQSRLVASKTMISRVTPLSGIEAVVQAPSSGEAELPPQSLVCSAVREGRIIVDRREYRVPEDEGYLVFDSALAKALRMLSIPGSSIASVKETVLESLKNSDGIDYEPISVSIEYLFSSSRIDNLSTSLSEIRSRLFDALVLQQFQHDLEESTSTVQAPFTQLNWGTELGSTTSACLAETSPITRNIGLVEEKNERRLNPMLARWSGALDLYKEQKAIVLPSRAERTRVLNALWHDEDFRGMPREYGGALILIIPSEGVELLRKKGFNFEVQDVKLN
jgi:hypothetical protein